MRKLNKKEELWVEKVKDTLRMGGRSERTIDNYRAAINRFIKYYDETKDIKKLKEDDIINYLKESYINKGLSSSTYNMNIYAIKFFYSVCFNKEFNKKLLLTAKLQRRLPDIINKPTFIRIFNEENNVKYKCWLLLSFCSGLRVEEIARIQISDINSKEHKLKVVGKRNKERFTILPDIVIKYLRLYYKNAKFIKNNEYLFEGCAGREYMNSRYISNYFSIIKKKYDLPVNITFHSLRHSFATFFIKAGGDPFVLKSMLGHSSLNTTSIYIHLGRDFNNLNGVKYE